MPGCLFFSVNQALKIMLLNSGESMCNLHAAYSSLIPI